MTFLGKTLLLLNFAFSLLLAVWSFALFSNRVDWTDRAGKSDAKGETPPGQFARRAELLKRLSEGIRPAEAGWRSATAELASAEGHRAADRVWYQQQRQHAWTTALATNPVQAPIYLAADDRQTGMKKGQIQIDPRTGYPVMQVAKDDAGKPLASLSSYLKQEEDLSRDLLALLQNLQQLAKEDTEQTALLVGDSARGTKGLQQRLEDETKKHAGVMAEHAIIKPLRINTEVESELILKRKKELVARIEELKKVPVATGP